MITDISLNPIVGISTVLGYNQSVDEFPHKLISYIQSSIVELDRRDVQLLYRLLGTFDDEWESVYGKILSLPDLYKPETCTAAVLEYLRYNVGIADNLNYIWGTLDEPGKRRLVKNFIRFLTLRSTDTGIRELFETMTGRPVELFSYFDYQWLLSGDGEYNMEGALGEEETGFDPWLISEYHEAFGIIPDAVTSIFFGMSSRYKFTVDTAVATYLSSEPDLPDVIRITYKPLSVSIVCLIVESGGHYYAYGPWDYFFEQAGAYSVDVNDFRTGFEIDQYIFDINVMDYEETLSHEMCQALAKFSRATHERIYIRYYRLIDLFDEDNGEWVFASSSSYIDTDERILILA